MLGYDLQRTSRVNDSNIPESPEEHCKFQTTHRHENFYTSPAVVDNTIFIGSFISNLPLFGSLPPYEPSINRPFWWWGDGYVYSIDSETCELNWEFNTGSWIEGSLVVDDGVVYVGNGDGFFYALDALTGERKWEYILPKENAICDLLGFSFIFYAIFCDTRAFFSSPLVFNNIVYFGSRDGYLNMLDQESGDVMKRVKVNGDMHSALALSLDQARLYGATAETSNNVYGFDVNSGEVLWQRDLQGQIYSLSPAVDNEDRVFWPSMEGKLAAFDGLTGEKLWEIDTEQVSRSSVSIGHDGSVYVAGFNGELIAVNPETGNILWRTTLESFSEGTSVGSDGLVVGDYAGYLTKLDTSGSEIWKYCATGNCDGSAFNFAIQGTPIIADNRVYFGSYDGNVYVVE